MDDARPAPLSSLGPLALVLVLVLLGLAAALLAGHAGGPLARGSTSELTITAPPAVWAVLFLLPLLVGFVAHFVRLILGSDNGWPARLVASLALLLVASLLLFVVVPSTPWFQTSAVTVGGNSPTSPGSGESSPGNATGGGNGTGAGSAGGGNVSGAGNGTGSGNSSGAGGGGNGSASGSGAGSGGSGSGSGSGGGGSGTGTGSGNSGGSGEGKGGGTGSGGGGGCGGGGITGGHLDVGPSAAGSPVHPGNCTGSGGGGSGGHSGSGGSGGTGGTGHNNSTTIAPRGTTSAPTVAVGVPNWVFLLLAVSLAAVVAVLSIPGLVPRRGRRRERRAGGGDPLGAAAAGMAVHDARVALENGEDPRESIVRLYCRLLGRVTPVPEDLAPFTAQEIQRTRLAALPILAARADAITRMFEEARYSSHPLGRPEADRYAETMRAVELDLLRAGESG